MRRSRLLVFLGGIGSLILLMAVYLGAAAVEPGNPAFQARWERTDDPVLNGVIARTWVWGPEANFPLQTEPYSDSPGGMRTVQYFDKSRMEINNPAGNPDDLFYVTNGLLVIELMTGQLQLGDNDFEQHSPAVVNVAGDADDPTGPTYETLAALRNLPPLADGALITQRVNRAGVVTDDPSLAAQGIVAAERLTVPGIDHQIAQPFWDFMNSSGTVLVDGQYVTEDLFTNPYYATGFPITEAYWANVKVAGTYKDVLMQCFERRCLTYTPGNSAGFQTEAGNVGQHYYTWRYEQIVVTPTATEPGASPTASASSTGTVTETPSATVTATVPATATATTVPPTSYTFASKFGLLSDPGRNILNGGGVAFDSAGNMYVADVANNRIQKYDPEGKYITQWGSPGAGNGQFSQAWDVAIDSADDVYVTDYNNNRVQKFDQNGQYLLQWGSSGVGNGQFDEPIGIAIDSANNIYVADFDNDRVQKFNSQGVYLAQWGVSGTGDGEFDGPAGIAIGPENAVYVTDYNNHRVQVFNQNGVYQRQWGSQGSGNGQYNLPAGIGLSPDGSRVYVGDYQNNRVQATDNQGVYQWSWGTLGTGAGELTGPSFVAAYDNKLYVTEFNSNRVQIVSLPDLGYLGQITGDSRGRFINPVGLTLDDSGNIIVVDYALNQVKVFTNGGGYVTQWGDPGTQVTPNIPLSGPLGVARDSQGNTYVTDSLNNRVVKYNAQGEQVMAWGGPGAGNGQFNGGNGIAVDADDNIYVADEFNHRIQKFSSSGVFISAWGTMGNGAGEFDAPGGVAVWGDAVYVTDQNNHRIQQFDLDGDYVRQWGSFGTGDGQFNIPAFVAVDSQGYIYITDSGNNRVQKFTPEGAYYAQFGMFGNGDGQFDNPLGIAIDASGNVVVADANNARVQIFSPS